MKRTECPDASRLAALLDGRLGKEERISLLGHLDECEDCFEWFCEAQRVRSEQEEADSPPVAGVSAGARPAPSLPWKWMAGAAAAVLAGWVFFHSPTPTPMSQLAVMVDPLTGGGEPLSPHLGRPAAPGFSRITPAATDFLLGTTMVDMYASLVEGQSSETRRLQSQALTLLSRPDRRAVYQRVAEPLAESVTKSRLLLWDLWLEAGASADYPLGRWAETLRLAAETERIDYLRSPARAELWRESEPHFPEPVRDALARLRDSTDPVQRSDRIETLRRELRDWIDSRWVE